MKNLKNISFKWLLCVVLFFLCIPFAYANGITIICNAVNTNTDPGQCGAVVDLSGAVVVIGGYGSITVVSNPPSGSFFPVGTTTVTYTATDDSGHSAHCSANVTVKDTEPPSVGPCPASITTSTDPGKCGAVVDYSVPVATDNCGVPSIFLSPPPGDFFSVGTSTVLCTAMDAAGNTATCAFDVTVNDTEAPTITCPANITTGTDPGQCTAVVTYTATATDNCPAADIVCNPPSGSSFPVGTTTVTCTATDVAGNTATCSFNVTVNDAEPPQAICGADTTVSTDPGQCTAYPARVLVATDNCGIAGSEFNPHGPYPVGTTTVTFTATDAAGNTATCSYDVTVNDTEPPEINCSPNVTVPTDPGQCTAGPGVSVVASDHCGISNLVCNHSLPGLFPVGTTTVTCTATDDAGNTATCSVDVTVNDTEPPTITCPANITTSTDPGQCEAVVTYTATATDNCPGVTVVCNPPSGSSFPVGTTKVACTATDAAGNTATCSFDVTVGDNEFPQVTCPANITVPADPGQCAGAVVTYTATATDNCPGVTLSCSPPSGSFFPVGTTTVTCTAIDAVGYTASCTFNVTVILQAEVDVKPRSCPNPLNINEMGVIPVAILGGNPCININDIDPSTVLLNGVAPLRYFTDDVASPVPNRKDSCDCTTLGKDGFLDLVFYFDAKTVIATLGQLSNGQVKVLTLTADLFNGNPIQGKDCVRINSKSKSGATTTASSTPTDFYLNANFPNPFNATTSISYFLSTEAFVNLNIYNILGQKVRTLVQENQTSGYKTVIWDGKNDSGEQVSSGIYFYRLQAGEFSETMRMTLLK